MSASGYRRLIGVDLGFVDSDAFTVLAWRLTDPTIYIEQSFKRAGQTVTDTGNRLEELVEYYKPIKIVMDAGALGKKITEELRLRWGKMIWPAEKQDRSANLRMFVSEVQHGRIKIVRHASQQLITEMKPYRWSEERDKVEPGQKEDCIDSALYGWRACKHFRAQEEPNAFPRGSSKWWEQRMKEEEQMDIDRHNRYAQKNDLRSRMRRTMHG